MNKPSWTVGAAWWIKCKFSEN